MTIFTNVPQLEVGQSVSYIYEGKFNPFRLKRLAGTGQEFVITRINNMTYEISNIHCIRTRKRDKVTGTYRRDIDSFILQKLREKIFYLDAGLSYQFMKDVRSWLTGFEAEYSVLKVSSVGLLVEVLEMLDEFIVYIYDYFNGLPERCHVCGNEFTLNEDGRCDECHNNKKHNCHCCGIVKTIDELQEIDNGLYCSSCVDRNTWVCSCGHKNSIVSECSYCGNLKAEIHDSSYIPDELIFYMIQNLVQKCILD